MKKSFSLRWISLLLAVMMVFSILPLSVFAVDTSTDDARYRTVFPRYNFAFSILTVPCFL